MSVKTEKQTLDFQAEVKELLHLMVHSLYSKKEIFLRELISNASDAADRLRFEALSNTSIYDGDADLKIWVDFDKDARTVTIRDNGIGMNRDDVIKNLGTIAKSGTKEFLSNLTGEEAKDSQLIGQFGVGFYSGFIIADRVTVNTRKAGSQSTEGVFWSSTGHGAYELSAIDKVSRGTEITLYLKDGEDEFLNSWNLRHIITKYSDHITLPIIMKKEAPSASEEETSSKEDVEIIEEETVNRATALWTLPKQKITDEQYEELYKHISNDFEGPLAKSHNKVEGKYDYISLLYIPSKAPFDLWHSGKSKGLKLYVQRVFIMDDADQFLPNYLRFTRGIIDSNDLPLNISREILQGNQIIDAIRSAITKRILSMLSSLSKNDKEKYTVFWKEFGSVLKEGPAEDFTNKAQIAKLLRFSSTKTDTLVQDVSLEDYVARMAEKQDKIYYVAAESFNAAKNSPHLEIFRQKGLEVLLLTDRVDEWLMAHLTEFDGKQLQSVAKGGLELGELENNSEKEEGEKHAGELKDTIEKMKEVLGGSVKDIRITRRLTHSPACIVADEHDMTSQMERIMRASGQSVPTSKPILELNPGHALVQRLKSGMADAKFTAWTQILFDQAVLSEGGQLEDPATFVQRLNGLLLELGNQ